MDKKAMFRGRDGGISNSRIIADICIIAGILMSSVFIAMGYFNPNIDLMKIATAIGVLFGAIAGTSMTFLFFQKKNEVAESKKPCDEPDKAPQL